MARRQARPASDHYPPEAIQESFVLYNQGGEQLDRFQRIETLDKVEGFLPTSRIEQVEALSLESFIGRPGGATKHLAEVARHQTRADTDDNMRGPRRITRQYIDWALDAQKAGRELSSLQQQLREDVNPTLRLNRVFLPEEPGLLPLLRYYDLALLRRTGSIESVGYDPQRVEYAPDNPGIMFYLQAALESWRVRQVTRLLPDAISHEALRASFWIERLVEVKDGYPGLRGIAQEGLDKFFGRESSE